MKRMLLALLLAVITLGANAQFEQGTNYANLSMSGLDLSYSKGEKFRLGLEASAGHFVADEWMLTARFGYQHQWVQGPGDVNNLELGAGFRYYIRQNGIFLGCGLMYEHANVHRGNYLDLTPEVGYCYYINQYLSIEPALYFNCCLNQFSEGSKVGLRLGVGYYF